jgi:pimeloyl-ACP methyl ester carboxylesterase
MQIKTMIYHEQPNLHLPPQVRTAQWMNEISSKPLCADQVRYLWSIADLKLTYSLLRNPIGLGHALMHGDAVQQKRAASNCRDRSSYNIAVVYPLEDPMTSMSLERIRQRALNRSPIRMAVSALFIAAGLATASPVIAGTERESQNMADTSDAALAASLPGDFRNGDAEVNGTRIHYVEGGKGTPLLLLPGWPQTWWEFHKIMPELAKHHRVIAVDLRGMGASAKPVSGYDKKNMAKDIHELTRALGYKQVNIAGHDIGAMVAYGFAANYPDATLKICLIDVAHPEESLYTLSLLPPPGYAVRGTGESTHPVYLWWFAFNQLPDLPQQLLAGKSRLLIDWLFDSQLRNPAAISERDRAIYAAAYSQPDAIRAGNGWYQTFGQDIIDAKHYGRIATPVLALAGERNYPYLRELLPTQASDVRVVKVNSSSHYVPEDRPEAVVRELLGFFES